ncbi:MAG: RusA family crossover junction endodeoxyribonuclease [Xanthomonadales bacterium]|nr:RusA family crossover junction endodeoxyribonuclease [Xanthomonadales bacterium]
MTTPTKQVTLILPWVVSVNHCHRPSGSGFGRRIVTDEVKIYRQIVLAEVIQARARGAFPRPTRIGVMALASCPNRNRHDLDNLWKVLLDSCTQAGLWDDDSQIDDLHIRRGAVHPKGRIILRVKEWVAPLEEVI